MSNDPPSLVLLFIKILSYPTFSPFVNLLNLFNIQIAAILKSNNNQKQQPFLPLAIVLWCDGEGKNRERGQEGVRGKAPAFCSINRFSYISTDRSITRCYVLLHSKSFFVSSLNFSSIVSFFLVLWNFRFLQNSLHPSLLSILACCPSISALVYFSFPFSFLLFYAKKVAKSKRLFYSDKIFRKCSPSKDVAVLPHPPNETALTFLIFSSLLLGLCLVSHSATCGLPVILFLSSYLPS